MARLDKQRLDKQVERNLTGKEFEKNGQVDKAVKLYEENIKERFEGNHPYDRLAIIYKKQGRIDDEIRVLKQAIAVFEEVVERGRGDGPPKLQKFKERLGKAQRRKVKNKT